MIDVARTTLRREALAAVIWAAALCVTLAGLVPVRDRLDSATPALALLAVTLLATFGSLRVAIVAAIASALAFNVYFTEPYESPRIESGASIVAFVVYGLVAVALSVVVNRLREQQVRGERRAAEAILLRDLTVDLARQAVWLQPPVASAIGDLSRALGLRGAAVVVRGSGFEPFEVGAGDDQVARRRASELLELEGSSGGDVRSLADRPDGLLAVPLASGSTVYGMLVVDASESVDEAQERVARSFANLVALACERAELVQRTIEARALEDADRARSALVQAVSHDLRTPLTSIRALASTVESVGPLTVDQREVIDEIEQQAERLARLVDHVLDLGRIEGGRLVLRRVAVGIDDVVRIAVDAASRPGEPPVVVELDDDLPDVEVDEPIMVQALVNLLENARRHGAPPIELRASARGESVEVRVVDHGRGVPESERRRIFDPSHAMRRATSDERSRGLGLSITAGFVEAHGGLVRVEPTAGGGATFVVTVPAAPRPVSPV